jgi:hypothetical protein
VATRTVLHRDDPQPGEGDPYRSYYGISPTRYATAFVLGGLLFAAAILALMFIILQSLG